MIGNIIAGAIIIFAPTLALAYILHLILEN